MSSEIDYIGQLEKIAFNRFGDNYMKIVAEISGFKLNNIERIFRNKYKPKLGDFIILCESLDLKLKLEETKEYPNYTDENLLSTDDQIINYEKKE